MLQNSAPASALGSLRGLTRNTELLSTPHTMGKFTSEHLEVYWAITAYLIEQTTGKYEETVHQYLITISEVLHKVDHKYADVFDTIIEKLSQGGMMINFEYDWLHEFLRRLRIHFNDYEKFEKPLPWMTKVTSSKVESLDAEAVRCD